MQGYLLFNFLVTYESVCLSACPPVRLSACPPVRLSAHLACPPICLPVYPSNPILFNTKFEESVDSRNQGVNYEFSPIEYHVGVISLQGGTSLMQPDCTPHITLPSSTLSPSPVSGMSQPIPHRHPPQIDNLVNKEQTGIDEDSPIGTGTRQPGHMVEITGSQRLEKDNFRRH